MASATLHSQNCLSNSRTSPHFNKHRPSPNSTLSLSRPRRKRRSGSNRSRSPMVVKLPAQNNLAMGQVRLLKRDDEVPPCLLEKGETSEILRKQTEDCSDTIEPHVPALFSGRSFFSSPSPSSVPLPRFLENHGSQTMG